MSSTYSKDLPNAFVITEEDIRGVARLLEAIGTVEFDVECRDGITRGFQSASEVLAYENPKSKAMTQLRMSARARDYSAAALVQFKDTSGSFRIFIELRGEEKVVAQLRSDLHDVIDGTRPWYHYVQSIDFLVFLFFAFIGSITVFAVAALLLLPGSEETAAVTPGSAASIQALRTQIVVFLVGIGLLACALLLNQLRDKVFPAGVFCIGQGKRRNEDLRKVQWIIVGLVVTGIVSFIAWLATKIVATITGVP